jgi:hypothetical protein
MVAIDVESFDDPIAADDNAHDRVAVMTGPHASEFD